MSLDYSLLMVVAGAAAALLLPDLGRVRSGASRTLRSGIHPLPSHS